MITSGELIRSINYVDDIAASLRRIVISIPAMSAEERQRLAESMRKSDPNFVTVLEALERGEG